MISVCLLVAAAALAGCAKPDTAPAEDPAPQADQTVQEPISEEDFESGEAKGAVQSDDEEQASDDTGQGETH